MIRVCRSPRAGPGSLRPTRTIDSCPHDTDVASARAIQYAKILDPDELRAVHFDLDPIRTEDLVDAWQRLGLGRLTLDVVDCPDRRLTRGAGKA